MFIAVNRYTLSDLRIFNISIYNVGLKYWKQKKNNHTAMYVLYRYARCHLCHYGNISQPENGQQNQQSTAACNKLMHVITNGCRQ